MLEVRSSGRKTFYQRYTDERGRERRFKIGAAALTPAGRPETIVTTTSAAS